MTKTEALLAARLILSDSAIVAYLFKLAPDRIDDPHWWPNGATYIAEEVEHLRLEDPLETQLEARRQGAASVFEEIAALIREQGPPSQPGLKHWIRIGEKREAATS